MFDSDLNSPICHRRRRRRRISCERGGSRQNALSFSSFYSSFPPFPYMPILLLSRECRVCVRVYFGGWRLFHFQHVRISLSLLHVSSPKTCDESLVRQRHLCSLAIYVEIHFSQPMSKPKIFFY